LVSFHLEQSHCLVVDFLLLTVLRGQAGGLAEDPSLKKCTSSKRLQHFHLLMQKTLPTPPPVTEVSVSILAEQT
jgi:hypothetical protein